MPQRPRPYPNVELDRAELDFIDDILLATFASESAREVARGNIATFGRFLLAHRDGTAIADATQADCVAFMTDRATTIAPKTLAKNYSDLRSFFATAQTDPGNPLDGRLSPMTRIKQPRTPKFSLNNHAATVDEVDRIIACFDLRTMMGLRNATMVSLMFRSGPRVSEVGRANLCDVDFDERYIDLPMTKNLDPRQPSIVPETWTLLLRYMKRRGDAPGPLFLNTGPRRKSDRLPVDAIKTIVVRAAAKAQVPVSPHALRRGFVVEYLTTGKGDTTTLMILGGWEDETMIMRYMGDKRREAARHVHNNVAARQQAARRGRGGDHGDRGGLRRVV